METVPGVMWVIAGRERLDWARKDESWSDVLEEHRLGNLDEKDCQQFLEAAKIPSNLWKGIFSERNISP